MKTSKPLAFILLLVGTLAVASVASAQLTEYKLLEPLPGITTNNNGVSTNAGIYLSNLFKLALSIAVVLAILRLIFGGFTYMSSDAFGQKSEAKSIINNALIGLGLAMSAWLIVATVLESDENGVFTFNLSLDAISLPENNNPPVDSSGTVLGGRGVLPGYTLSAQQVAQDTTIRTDLENHRPSISVNNGPCTTGGTQGCTNLVGLPPHAISKIKSIASACNCELTITGGTEGGHTNHGPSVAVVDFRPTSALNNYLAKTNPAAANPKNKTQVKIGGTTYTYETLGANGRSSGIHWHVSLQ